MTSIQSLRRLFEQRAEAQSGIMAAVASADQVIRERYPRMAPYQNLRLVEVYVNKDNDLSLEYTFFDGEENNSLTHILPFEVVVGGRVATQEFFKEEERKKAGKRKQEQEQRELDYKEQRKRQYEKLKNEFEPNTTAIVKSNEVRSQC